MKPIVTFFLVYLLCSPAFSQLLRQSIYNFEPGDVYCVENYWHAGSSTTTVRYDLYQITSKAYNSDSSAVRQVTSCSGIAKITFDVF